MTKKDKLWGLTARYKENYEPNHDKGWANLQRKMKAEQVTSAKVVQMSSMRRWLRVAAVFVAFVGGAFIFQQLLHDGMESLATNEGVTKEIQLSDGSTIWLNENSELRYPATFEENERVVYLKGEAFFDVAKNTEQPFKIKMADAEVRVVGTSFNVRSHDAEDFVEVQVESGKVVFTADENKPMPLLPTEKAVFNKKSETINQSMDKNLNASAWKRKELRFKDTPFTEVFECMERFYKIKLTLENKAMLECTATTGMMKDGLETAMTVLNNTHQLEFVKQSNGQYLIKGGSCPN